jgi:selenocysteine lyase/cysteine desulfurase
MAHTVQNAWRERIVGLHKTLPLLDGTLAPYVHLDNAASTPPLRDAVDTVAAFLPYYSSVHRGCGFKSRVSTAAYEDARRTLTRFLGACPDGNNVIFGKNTTEAINKLAFRYPLTRSHVVLSTAMEHHSNDLPWRNRATVIRARVNPSGRLDEDHVDELLDQYGKRIALVTVSGASNVTGFVQPIHRLARKAHEVGARILVDAAQLAPHRPIDMKPNGDPEHLDFVALSAHKMYAPFGTGALVGHRDVFMRGAPEYQGGGTVDIVTATNVSWASAPDRDEAGSPNVVGAVAMAAAAEALMACDMAEVSYHEAALTSYALERLGTIRGVRLYGEQTSPADRDRVGVVPFTVDDVPHGLVAAVLGYEGGIGVRSGCFCAQQYVTQLLGLQAGDRTRFTTDRATRPGMVRVSFGAYNTLEEVDAMADLVESIALRRHGGRYVQQPNGDFVPRGYLDPIRAFFAVTSSSVMPYPRETVA